MADLAVPRKSTGRNIINEDNLPHWAGAVKIVLLVQPSSAAAGRVWLLTPNRLFRSAAGCIQAYVETSVMARCNHCRDNNVDVLELPT